MVVTPNLNHSARPCNRTEAATYNKGFLKYRERILEALFCLGADVSKAQTAPVQDRTRGSRSTPVSGRAFIFPSDRLFENDMEHKELLEALRAADEAGLREIPIPFPKTQDETLEIIRAVTEREHDYGTCVYAMSIAAQAAFNYVCTTLGTTGFQASCADLDFVRRNRLLKGPFALYKGEDMLFPQYDIEAQVRETLAEWKPWAKEEAAKKLAEVDHAHPDVIDHWQRLAA